MIPLFKVRMSDMASEAVSSVLGSGFIGQGSVVEEFEDALWKELKSSTRPITVNSCTSAIDLALELCGVGPNDEVISTPMTCFASQVGAIHRNARIRWADIDKNTGLIDAESVASLITSRTKAIIAVNWSGKFANYSELKKFGIPVIEDAAHTWDVFDHEMERGDYICYSLQAIKFLTSSDGGILIVPKNKEQEARLLRWYGLDRTKNENFRCTQNIQRAGFKYHMNDVMASIGMSNIVDARDSVMKHKANAKIMCDELSGNLDYATVLEYDSLASYWIFPVLLNDDIDRDEFSLYLNDRGISNSQVHFRNDLYDSTSMFREKELSGVDSFCSKQINIPCGWWLTDQEINYIIDTIKGFSV